MSDDHQLSKSRAAQRRTRSAGALLQVKKRLRKEIAAQPEDRERDAGLAVGRIVAHVQKNQSRSYHWRNGMNHYNHRGWRRACDRYGHHADRNAVRSQLAELSRRGQAEDELGLAEAKRRPE